MSKKKRQQNKPQPKQKPQRGGTILTIKNQPPMEPRQSSRVSSVSVVNDPNNLPDTRLKSDGGAIYKCRKCWEYFPAEEMVPDPELKLGFKWECKKCRSRYMKQYFARNIEKKRETEKKWIKARRQEEKEPENVDKPPKIN